MDRLGKVGKAITDADGDGDYANEIREEKNYYPFGLQHKGYNNTITGREHPYGYNGKENEEELGKNTLAYGWRDYDPAIGRFNKIDRFAEKYQNLSPYSYAANNPIKLKDIQGDSISGVSKKDARRARRLIRKNFRGSKNRKIRRLFRTKGKNFKSISKSKLAKATKGADSEAVALAGAYAQAINSENIHKVEVVKRGDKLSSFSQKKTALGILGRKTANDIERLEGGGVNAPLRNGGNLSVIVMDSQVPTPMVGSKTLTNVISNLSHELLGHGVGRVLNSGNSEHVDAIQMENLSLRVQGLGGFQNDGTPHKRGSAPLPMNIYSGIPTHFQQ